MNDVRTTDAPPDFHVERYPGILKSTAVSASGVSLVNSSGTYAAASHASASNSGGSAEALAIGFAGLPHIGNLSNNDGGLSPESHIRYDHQTESKFILGTELDLSIPGSDGPAGTSLTRMAAAGANLNPDEFSVSRGFQTDTSALATARLRLGYAMGDYMVYWTGGVAYTSIDDTATTSATYKGMTLSESQSSSEDAVGAVIVGGISTFVADNATVSIEGLYYEFDEEIDFWSGGEKVSVSLDDAFSVMIKFSIRAD